MTDLPTISAAVDQTRRGELTPLDLVERCLARIDECESDIRAWVLVDADGARQEAERLTQLAKGREIVGPLHGIPIGIKDIIDVAGMPTKAGSPLREDGPPADCDAPVVAALRKAGAIILGKTVTTEWACFDPPPTRNPWNLARTPGGSSSGSAAAVATGMCLAALGTQTGGSIIRPAAYCGVCGLKPTFASLPMERIVPVSTHLDHVGPITRTAADAAVVYAVIAGERCDIGEYLGPRGPTWNAVDDYFCEQASYDVGWIYGKALRERLGAATFEPPRPLPKSFATLHENHARIMAVGAAQVHRDNFAKRPDAFGPQVASLIETGLATSEADYAAALEHQKTFRTTMDATFGNVSLLLTPATPATAPGPETTGDAKFNAPWSYSGLPAVTIPCGLSEEGLPVGLQLVGRRGAEAELLSAAAWCEERLEPLAYDGLPRPSN